MNTLLEFEKPIPFEFLINGQFLRTTVDEFLTANGISAETTLNIEYVRAVVPPSHVASYEHDDWVSSVDVLSATSPAGSPGNVQSGQERILSGSYDGLLRVWNMSSEVLATSSGSMDGGHTSGVKAAKFLSPTQVVSSGLDRTIRIWNYTEPEDAAASASLVPSLELYGHKSSVDGLAVHAASSRILSASADHTIGVWSTRKSDAPAAPANLLPSASAAFAKRRKLSKNASQKQTPQRGPLAQLSGHGAPVSATIFKPADATVAYSASWDHTLRTWDLTTGALVSMRTTSHPLFSLTALDGSSEPSSTDGGGGGGVALLAAGSSARHITLIDPRSSAANVAAMTLRGHANAVVALAPDPAGAFGLASASHDGTVRIWDIRSVRPGAGTEGQVGEAVYVVPRETAKGERRAGGEGVKVFGVCWDREVGIVSAGEDRRVQINRGQGEPAGGG